MLQNIFDPCGIRTHDFDDSVLQLRYRDNLQEALIYLSANAVHRRNN